MINRKASILLGAIVVVAGSTATAYMNLENAEAVATADRVAEHIIETSTRAASWYQAHGSFKGISDKELEDHSIIRGIRDEGGMLLSAFRGRVTFDADTYHTDNDSISVTLYQVPDAGCTAFIRKVQSHFSQITISDYELKEHHHGLFIPSLKGACTTQNGTGTVTLEATINQLLGKEPVISAYRESDE